MSLRLNVSVTDRGALGPQLQTRVRALLDAERSARLQAAQTATTTSRRNVKRIRDLAPPRKGRYHGLQDALQWQATKGGMVQLDMNRLNTNFKPWLVQEIGTGQSATEKLADKPNPIGRPAKGATYVKTVKSQLGRRISPGLVFASRGGHFQRPSAALRNSGQQLYLRRQVTGAPARFDRATRRSEPGIRISKEIKGQHFVQKGGREGFREYRNSVLAAARSQLRKRKT